MMQNSLAAHSSTPETTYTPSRRRTTFQSVSQLRHNSSDCPTKTTRAPSHYLEATEAIKNLGKLI